MQDFALRFDEMLNSLKAALRTFLEPAKPYLTIFADFRFGVVLTVLAFVVMMSICAAKDGRMYAGEVKKTRTVAMCSMLIAINVIAESLAQDLTAYIRVSFGFVTVPIAAMLFGPYAACMVGILQDVAGFLVRPTGAFILTLTMNEGITGMIMGILLYKKKVSVIRVLVAEIVVSVFVSVILNSVALAPTVGSGLVGILPSRIIKNIIMLPVQTAVVYAILKVIRLRVKR